MVVDDESNFREIISAKLTAAGFDVVVAKNEAEALAGAEQFQPDLILMDIFMPPGKSGTDVALSLKQNPKTEHIKVAFLTSLKEPWPAIGGDREKVAKELGMDDFFDKTKDLDALPQKVQELLTRPSASV